MSLSYPILNVNISLRNFVFGELDQKSGLILQIFINID